LTSNRLAILALLCCTVTGSINQAVYIGLEPCGISLAQRYLPLQVERRFHGLVRIFGDQVISETCTPLNRQMKINQETTQNRMLY